MGKNIRDSTVQLIGCGGIVQLQILLFVFGEFDRGPPFFCHYLDHVHSTIQGRTPFATLDGIGVGLRDWIVFVARRRHGDVSYAIEHGQFDDQ